MKHGWEYKKLGELVNVKTGKLDANAASKDGEYPFFTCSKETLRISNFSYDCECVLIAGNGDLNVKYFKGKFDAYQRTYIITLKDNVSETFVTYIYNFFNSYIEELRNKSIGGIIKYIKLGDITNANIPLPPLSVQQCIVSELDKINELIRLKKEQLKDYDNLAQSIFYEMFGDPVVNEKGWEVKKLGEEYKVSSSKRIMQNEWTTEGVPFLKVSDVVSKINGQNSEPSTFISETTYSKLVDSNAVPVQNDILITSRGTLGLCYIVKNEDRFYFQDGMITWLAECKGNITPLFLTYLFKNHHFLQQITSKANKSTVAYISISQISKRKIPLPPLPLQQLFAQRIELIEQQKAAIQSAIADLETLLASRMQYWFD